MTVPYWKEGNIREGMEKLVEEATRAWETNDCVIDDITVLLVFLN